MNSLESKPNQRSTSYTQACKIASKEQGRRRQTSTV